MLAAAALTLIILFSVERILRTEAGARHKAEQLQLTLENMSQGIMLVTKDLQIPIINSRCGELLGLPARLRRASAKVRSTGGVSGEERSGPGLQGGVRIAERWRRNRRCLAAGLDL